MTEPTNRTPTSIWTNHFAFAAVVVVSIACYWKLVAAVVAYSLSHESSSHILLIPAVTGALLFVEHKKVLLETCFSFRVGVPVIVAGASLYLISNYYFAGNAGNSFDAAGALALVVTWIGGFILAYGWKAARLAAFPLGFLLLAIPFPEPVLDRIVYALQVGSTEITYLLFKILHVPVLRQGFVLAVPGVTIEVATECSGIRSTMALFITCLLAAHLYLRSRVKMLVFVLLVLPLAIVKNGIRIATLTLLSIYVDPGFLTGNLHREGGFAFFLLALALLAPVLFFMERTERPSRLQSP
jgi:exosortase